MNALERKKEQQKNALSDARRALENCEKRKTECQINSEPASTSPYNCDDLKKQLEDIQSDIGSYQRLIKQYTEE